MAGQEQRKDPEAKLAGKYPKYFDHLLLRVVRNGNFVTSHLVHLFSNIP